MNTTKPHQTPPKPNPGDKINVLDHGHVRYVDHLGSDQRVVEAARVSYQSPSKGEVEDKKLLHYLWRNKHTSPFEMIKVTFDIKMPIFVARQYVRHRMQNMNEMSARYTELPGEFYIPSTWRTQDPKNKQGSVAQENWNPTVHECPTTLMSATAALEQHCQVSYEIYQAMIKAGIAREMARMILPLNIYTQFYATWDMKNLLHFVTLRDDSHAQAEIQEYGRAIKTFLYSLFPWTMEAYERWRFIPIDTWPPEVKP